MILYFNDDHGQSYTLNMDHFCFSKKYGENEGQEFTEIILDREASENFGAPKLVIPMKAERFSSLVAMKS